MVIWWVLVVLLYILYYPPLLSTINCTNTLYSNIYILHLVHSYSNILFHFSHFLLTILISTLGSTLLYFYHPILSSIVFLQILLSSLYIYIYIIYILYILYLFYIIYILRFSLSLFRSYWFSFYIWSSSSISFLFIYN